MERLSENQEPRGISAAALRTWGYLFLLLGIAAVCVIQRGVLEIPGMTGQQLLELMNTPGDGMALVTASLIMKALESCAIPIFALLAVERFSGATDWKPLLGGAALVAVLSELPYNLAMSGKLWEPSSRNPAFGLVLALVMLWFYRYLEERSGKSGLVKLLITLAAVLWGGMLRIEHGTFLIAMTCILWLIRGKSYRILLGALAAAAGCLISLYYAAAPISFLAIHFYNGEEGEHSRLWELACYPALLLLGFLAAQFV